MSATAFAVQQNIVRAERPALGPAQHHQERQRLDARRRQRGQGGACRSPRAAAPPGLDIKELFDQSVFVDRFGDGVLREGAIAAGAHGADDPAVSRFVAHDARRHDLDPAGDADLARRALFPRRDDQHDDARRPGARGRHSRRRFDGDDREHPPLLDEEKMPLPQATLHGAAGSPCRPWSRRSPSAASSPR